VARPRAGFLSRGFLSSLRRRNAPADDPGASLSPLISREVASATKALRGELRELRERHHDLRQQVRLLHAVMAANAARHVDRHAASLNASEVGRHVSAAIAAAPLDLLPMPHLVIDQLLPAATYRALLDATPPDECFSDRDLKKQNFRLTPGKIVPDFTTVMWRFVEEDVIASSMVPALLARFQPHIEAVYRERFGDRAAHASALRHQATAGRLMLRRPGYHLDPHIDPQRVVVTCLLYLARPGDSPEFGTQLFSLNAVPQIAGTKTYYPGEAGYVSSLVKTVRFTPNTAVAFLNAGAAAHGATIPAEAPADTKRYAYQFYVSPDPDELAAVSGGTVAAPVD
jgi:hypothetical protein